MEVELSGGGTHKVNHNPMVSTLQEKAACRHVLRDVGGFGNSGTMVHTMSAVARPTIVDSAYDCFREAGAFG
jgi:hypothetical protein